jgi:hypothetical protein
VAKTQQTAAGDSTGPPDPDLLAAVVLHTLVSDAREGMTVSRLAKACERDPSDTADRDEIEAALEILLDDGLARCEEEIFMPTRAAIRASELSF